MGSDPEYAGPGMGSALVQECEVNEVHPNGCQNGTVSYRLYLPESSIGVAHT